MDLRTENRVPVQRPVKLTVLGDQPQEFEAYLNNVSGRGLRVVMDAPVALDAAVRVDLDDSIILGEVCYCEPCGNRWALGLEMEQSLSDLRGLCRLVERLLQEERRGQGEPTPAPVPPRT
ncbi:MAG: PilZ domain-containing protein [Bryobacterales bacterium]|nr:PilZ domain-containing protein [Bryobacterales bacterium]